MTPVEIMAKAARKEFIDHVVDKANPHWGAQNPDYLKQACKIAGYPNPDEAADFFVNAAMRAALLALAEADVSKEMINLGWGGGEDARHFDACFRAMLRALAKEESQ